MRRPHVAVCAAFLAACSSTEKPPAAPPPAPHDMAITGADFAFTAPDTIPAGLTHVTFENKGTMLHHVQFVRLDSGKTFADLAEALKHPGAPPAWAVVVPGPNAPDPGGTSNATVDLAAGAYGILCFVDIPGGVPHFAKGMMRALTVRASEGAAAAAADSADVQVVLADYSFKLSRPLTSGAHVIEVTSRGPQEHELEIVRFAPGKTLEDLATWMAKPEGPPPANAIGGTSGQLPGTTVRFSVDLTPGN
ncbi:MAG TPA: hypothetical protein VG916_02045, partial [Gemmatimonadaceae bacterium]|nr:hypothetical protein [Gemmatimonadaceae bacterium]